MSRSTISPAILYWGTPVVLVTSVNEEGSFNIAPMSSAWWLGDRCMLALSCESQTTMNMLRTKECVLNLVSDDLTDHVNAFACTTGTPIVPPRKQQRGYSYINDKFGVSKVHPQPSEFVSAPRILECPVQMEAQVLEIHESLGGALSGLPAFAKAIECKILRTYVTDELRMPGYKNRIDPNKWKPMIMSFQQLYGLRNGKLSDSVLGKIDEEQYRMLDMKDVDTQASEADVANSEVGK